MRCGSGCPKVAGKRPTSEGWSPGSRISMYPHVAPHTAKFHTLITPGIRHRAKALVFQLREHRPCGFDSHRPLHFPLPGVSPRCHSTRPARPERLGSPNFRIVRLVIPRVRRLDLSLDSRRNFMKRGPRKLSNSPVQVFHAVMAVAFLMGD